MLSKSDWRDNNERESDRYCFETISRVYAYKKREVRLFFTLLKGFAIPVLSRKTTEVHARYVQPTRP